jgi:integrase
VSPIPANSLGQRIRRLGERAGVPVTTHLLRYYAATMLVGDGVDPVTAAQRMGHDPALMMRTYANFLPSKDVSAAELLGRHVLGPTKEEK